MIHVRETRPTERFELNDKFIAWFDGDAAGTMASTPDLAVKKLIALTSKSPIVDPHDPDGGMDIVDGGHNGRYIR